MSAVTCTVTHVCLEERLLAQGEAALDVLTASGTELILNYFKSTV